MERKFREIYLDHAATTPMRPEVLEEMLPWMDGSHVGNPNSIHSRGLKARHAVEHAREQVAAMLNCSPDEVFFTSGATESNNLWMSLVPGWTCLTLPTEHHSILDALPAHGLNVKFLPVARTGELVHGEMVRALEGTGKEIVSMSWFNSEIGVEQNISWESLAAHKHGALMHCDASQAAGHTKIDMAYQGGLDFLTFAGHKMGGPMGVGVLYIRKETQEKLLKPVIAGGGQQGNFRAGTENVPGIVGLGKACELAQVRLAEHRHPDMYNLTFDFLWALEHECHSVCGRWDYNGPRWERRPVDTPIVSLTIRDVNAEVLLMLLDREGVYASAGSACSSKETSHVLRALGFTEEEAASTIRISFGVDQTKEEVEEAAKVLASCIEEALSLKGAKRQ